MPRSRAKTWTAPLNRWVSKSSFFGGRPQAKTSLEPTLTLTPEIIAALRVLQNGPELNTSYKQAFETLAQNAQQGSKLREIFTVARAILQYHIISRLDASYTYDDCVRTVTSKLYPPDTGFTADDPDSSITIFPEHHATPVLEAKPQQFSEHARLQALIRDIMEDGLVATRTASPPGHGAATGG